MGELASSTKSEGRRVLREYHLSDRAGYLRPWFRAELLALSYYPEDWASFEQAQLLVQHEHSRFLQSAPANYQPTPLVNSILTTISKTEAQRTTCGLVAIALLGLKNAGESVSLRRAANVVSEYGNSVKGLEHYFRSNGVIKTNVRPVTGDVSTVESTFRKYRSVAHICGAAVASAEYFEIPKAIVDTPEADACFLSTVMFFQQELAAARNFKNWNLWHIRADPPFEYKDYPHLIPNASVIKALFDPWIERGRPSGR